jgi:hypothetical protein
VIDRTWAVLGSRAARNNGHIIAFVDRRRCTNNSCHNGVLTAKDNSVSVRIKQINSSWVPKRCAAMFRTGAQILCAPFQAWHIKDTGVQVALLARVGSRPDTRAEPGHCISKRITLPNIFVSQSHDTSPTTKTLTKRYFSIPMFSTSSYFHAMGRILCRILWCRGRVFPDLPSTKRKPQLHADERISCSNHHIYPVQ